MCRSSFVFIKVICAFNYIPTNYVLRLLQLSFSLFTCCQSFISTLTIRFSAASVMLQELKDKRHHYFYFCMTWCNMEVPEYLSNALYCCLVRIVTCFHHSTPPKICTLALNSTLSFSRQNLIDFTFKSSPLHLWTSLLPCTSQASLYSLQNYNEPPPTR